MSWLVGWRYLSAASMGPLLEEWDLTQYPGGYRVTLVCTHPSWRRVGKDPRDIGAEDQEDLRV
jgi:hypothetical protein